MKTAVSLSVFDAPAGMPALYSGATKENLNKIRRLGYDGVDLFVREPWSALTQEAVRRLKSESLGIGVVMPAALAAEGIVLGSSSREIRDEAVRRMKEMIVLAERCGAMISLGLVRGNVENGETKAAFYDRFLDSCQRLLKISEPAGVPLLIEPINRYEINHLNSLSEAASFIRASGLPLYLMADTFHMNIEDTDLEKAVEEAFLLIRHIHFVDSNRLAPSMGHLDLEKLYGLLEQKRYSGYLCLEALPLPDGDTGAERGAGFFQQMKEKMAERTEDIYEKDSYRIKTDCQ